MLSQQAVHCYTVSCCSMGVSSIRPSFLGSRIYCIAVFNEYVMLLRLEMMRTLKSVVMLCWRGMIEEMKTCLLSSVFLTMSKSLRPWKVVVWAVSPCERSSVSWINQWSAFPSSKVVVLQGLRSKIPGRRVGAQVPSPCSTKTTPKLQRKFPCAC